jgi:predicted N-acetyltransferase YhbS
MRDIHIRETHPQDIAAIQALYPAAFPDEDLLPLVGRLLDEVPGLISLGAFLRESLIGHVIFTPARAMPGRMQNSPYWAPSPWRPRASARVSARRSSARAWTA